MIRRAQVRAARPAAPRLPLGDHRRTTGASRAASAAHNPGDPSINKARVRLIAGWVVVSLLAIAFALGGIGKLTGGAGAQFSNWGYAPWFAYVIGAAELAGAVGLLIPRTTRLAVIGLLIIMLGAIYTHLTNNEVPRSLVPVAFIAALCTAWWLRPPVRTVVTAQSPSG